VPLTFTVDSAMWYRLNHANISEKMLVHSGLSVRFPPKTDISDMIAAPTARRRLPDHN